MALPVNKDTPEEKRIRGRTPLQQGEVMQDEDIERSFKINPASVMPTDFQLGNQLNYQMNIMQK